MTQAIRLAHLGRGWQALPAFSFFDADPPLDEASTLAAYSNHETKHRASSYTPR